MDSFIRIALWNANGLVQHFQEVKLFINHHNIDILLISETHFTINSYFNVSNFSLYTTNHPSGRARGGTAVLVKNGIKHYELPHSQYDYLQATSIVVDTKTGPIAVSAIYCPPAHAINNGQFTDFFSSLGVRFLAGGDYNAKHHAWGSRLSTPRGRELHRSILDNQLTWLSTGEPTYWPTDRNKIPDLLDFFIVKGISNEYLNISSCLDLSSDHSPIIVTVSRSIKKRIQKPFLCNNNTNWDLFRESINKEIHLKIPLQTKSDIEEAITNLNLVIQNAAWKSTPKAFDNKIEKNMYPIHIKRMVAEKRRLRRIWQNTRHPADKTRLNRAIRNLKQELLLVKNSWFDQYTQSLSPTKATNYSLWKATKYLKNATKYLPPIKKEDGTWAKSNEDKAQAFSKHFSSVFQPYVADPQIDEQEIFEYLESPQQMSPPIVPFTPSEVKKCINNELNPKKSPGYDLITGKVLQELPKQGILLITFIFNAILRLEYFPLQWKVAEIVVVPKAGKPPNDVSSYRPISLLPTMSKLFEKIFLKRLMPIICCENLIPEHQFGFRKQHSTIQQVHRITNVIRQTLEERNFCTSVFLDVRQAFDKVWHPGLCYKLKHILPHPYYNVLRSYLSDRHFTVKLDNDNTALCKIDSGVPQGSVLGPILYTLFTADIPTIPGVMMATYADDTALLSSHEDVMVASATLQNGLNELSTWFNKWRVRVNETKSVHVTFSLRRDHCPPVVLNNVILPQTESVKYLGIHLDKRLNWRTHIWTKRQQLNLKLRNLEWLIGNKSKLSIENKLLLYKIFLKPIWTYGIQLWGTASNSNIEIIQRFQSKLIRKIVNAPWFVSNNTIHRDLKMFNVREEISRFSSLYLQKLDDHPNHLAVNLLDNSEAVDRLKRCTVLDLPLRFL